MSHIIVVKATFDEEAGVWTTESSDIHGLRIEAPTLEALLTRLPIAIQDLLETSDGGGENAKSRDVPIELIAHASTRVRLGMAA